MGGDETCQRSQCAPFPAVRIDSSVLYVLRAELRSELERLAERVGALERGQVRIEGLLEGASLFRSARDRGPR